MTCFLNKCLSFELYWQLTKCSINLMRLKKFEIAEVVLSISLSFSTDFTDVRRETREFVRNRENDILTIDLFFSSRSRNIKRRRLSSTSSSSSTNAKRERFSKSSSADESSSSRAEIIEFESLFVSQNEQKNENENAFSEQYFDDFSSDDETIQDAVLPSVEKHETAINSALRSMHENRVSISQQITAVKRSSSLLSNWFSSKRKKFQRIYKMRHRIFLED